MPLGIHDIVGIRYVQIETNIDITVGHVLGSIKLCGEISTPSMVLMGYIQDLP